LQSEGMKGATVGAQPTARPAPIPHGLVHCKRPPFTPFLSGWWAKPEAAHPRRGRLPCTEVVRMPYIKVSIDEYVEHEAQHAEDPEQTWNGFSPGGAAAKLGITREAIHRGISRGAITAIRVHDRNRKLRFIHIPEREIEHYRQHHLNWASQRKTG